MYGQNIQDLWDIIKRPNVMLIGVDEGKRYSKIIVENS
jgi:hypothetical protein